MLRLSVPVALGAGVLQLSTLLDKGIAFLLAVGLDESGQRIERFMLLGEWFRYPMELGAAARLNWAQYLYQFPLGIFAIALATAIFPSLSDNALDADRERFRAVLRRGIEATLLIGLPASVGLIVVRYPAIRLLFERGEFTPDDTRLVARSLAFYAAAVWAFSLQQIFNRAYYALHDTLTPLVMSIVTLVVNLAVELPLIWTALGEAGMAAGTCASFVVQSLVMLAMLSRRVGGLEMRRSLPFILKTLVASAVMLGACLAAGLLPIFEEHRRGKEAWAAQLFILMASGAVSYGLACSAMGIPVWRYVIPRRRSVQAIADREG